MYSSLGRHVGYREQLFRGVGCVLDKGLELSRRAKSGGGKVGGALEEDVLLESEPVDVMPGTRLAETVFVWTILMRAASFTWTLMYTIDMTALTRRVCHRQGHSGSAGIENRAPRCVLKGSLWLSEVMTGQLEQLWRGLIWEWPSQLVLCATSVKRLNISFSIQMKTI